MRAVLGIAAAVVRYALGAIFGLNGSQWGWWRWCAFGAASLTLVVSVPARRFAAALSSNQHPGWLAAGAVAGAALLTVSVAVMSSRYSDPYNGRLLWPHALAVVALVGFAALLACGTAWANSAELNRVR